MTSIEYINGAALIKGELTFTSVAALFEQTLQAHGPDVIVDLAHSGRVDSAGVALLVEWASRAHEQGKTLKLQNVAADTATLIRIGGIESMLGMVNDKKNSAA
ncbi:MAG: STAS domain-containing protein [Arenicellales bacterium WSBS_2016_MAG_OTU3]